MQSLWRDARVELLDGRTGYEKIIRWMIFDRPCPEVGSGVQRSDRPCWGFQGGEAHWQVCIVACHNAKLAYHPQRRSEGDPAAYLRGMVVVLSVAAM